MKSILFLVTLILSTVASAADLPRVAVVPDSPEPSVAAFADLLSASLASASGRYALVERVEITRLASEAEVQKLAADQRPAALAKLAKADGLIIVGADKGDPKLPKLTLRLTSTNNGLVLRSLILGGKEDEYPKAAELAAGVLRFPCERLTHGDAKPPVIVSLLGIRPAFEIDRALETTLNLAVAQQLSAQSGIAVSERWKMHDLVFERSLADEKPQAFATGSFLLEGSYTHKNDKLEFNLVLRKSVADAGEKITLEGSSSDLTKTAREIAILVAKQCGQVGEEVAWNPIEEANQYKELGHWLRRRSQGRASASAYESAVALGLSEGPVLRERIWAYQSILGRVGTYTLSRTDVGGWEKLSKAEFKEILSTAIRLTQVTNEAVHAKWGGDFDKNFSKNDKKFILKQTFDFDLQALQAVCMRKEQLELATEVRSLRGLCRELVAIGEADAGEFSPGFAQRFYMFETPAEAAEDLRRLLSPEKLNGGKSDSPGSDIRDELWKTCQIPEVLRFVDWSSVTNGRGDAAWADFVSSLRTSKSLLERADGLALAIQTSGDAKDRERIFSEFCDLLESHADEILTPQGQLCFYSFGYFYLKKNKELFPNSEQRMARLFRNMLEKCDWLEIPAVHLLFWSVTNWSRENGKGNAVIPETEAASMLECIEAYMARAAKDPRWKSVYTNLERKWWVEISSKIVVSYPRLKEQRIRPRPVLAGAVSIRAWKPEGPGLTDSKNWLFGEAMISSGDSLFVPMIKQGVIDLDVKTMKVKRVYDLPEPGFRFIGSLACNEQELMICMNKNLHVRPLSENGKSWTPVELPSVTSGDPLSWCIRGMGDSFFLGSFMTVFEVESPRTLVGNCRDGKTTWEASSNRRPALNPLDSMNPRNTLLAYRNSVGNTMVLLGELNGRAPLIELKSGREVASMCGGGIPQMRGEIPLYWKFRDQEIEYLVACDPAKEQPDAVFRSGRNWRNAPQFWINVNILSDTAAPELRGKFIAAIVHGGKLWMLKREPEVPGKYEENDPEGFRLVRCGLDGKGAVSIPLHYDVPEAIRALGRDKSRSLPSLDRPTVNARSLTATPKGLFFASSGYDGARVSGGRIWAGDLAPVLLYITWDDIHEWLAKNAPASANPSSP